MRTIVAWKPLNYEVRLRENKLRENHSGMETGERADNAKGQSALRENHSGMETGLYFKNASRKSVA